MIGVRMVCGAMFIISSFVANLSVIVILRVIIFACDHITSQVYQPAYFIDIVGPDYASISFVGPRLAPGLDWHQDWISTRIGLHDRIVGCDCNFLSDVDL